MAFEWELTKETIYLPLGCLQGGLRFEGRVFDQCDVRREHHQGADDRASGLSCFLLSGFGFTGMAWADTNNPVY